MREHQVIAWRAFPMMEDIGGGYYKMPEGFPSLPLMFSIKATRE